MKEWMRYFLPGVFSEVHHWRERALLAEKRLGEVVSEVGATIAHQREQFDAERRELQNLLAGNTSQKPPQRADEEGVDCTTPSFSLPSHPIGRKIKEFQESQAKSLPDEMVEMAVDEYLRLTAVQ